MKLSLSRRLRPLLSFAMLPVLASLATASLALARLDSPTVSALPPAHLEEAPVLPQGRLTVTGDAAMAVVGKAGSLAIRIDTGGAILRHADITLDYDAARIAVSALDFSSSPCSAVEKQEIDARSGSIHFACSLAGSGTFRQILTVAAIDFVPRTSGTARWHFDRAATSLSSANQASLLRYAPDFDQTIFPH